MEKLYKKNLLLFLSLGFFVCVQAQTYVTIPDANFAAWINTNYPACMNGNQMDITCSGITGADSIDVASQNISDLTGIEYFTGCTYLNCSYNPLTSLPGLPTLPPNLLKLYCIGNQLTGLPPLPVNLVTLYCTDNYLTILPQLPITLTGLYCTTNQLTSLPTLPNSLLYLLCEFNQLTILPMLPPNLKYLYCQNNILINLSPLPDYLSYFDCRNNNIACFPVFPSIYSNKCEISGNPFACLPNYVSAMDAATLAYPLCISGDPVNNPNGCPGADGIAGYTFKDINSSCLMDSADSGLVHIPVQLFDNVNIFLKKTYSLSNSVYHLQQTVGTYIVEIDTMGLPFTVQCTSPGIDSIVTLSSTNPLVSEVNFEIACKPGFDVGVQTILRSGWVFPGQQHQLQIIAGDLSKWYNLNCTGSAGVSGQVEVTATGPVTFNGITSGSLTPSVSGNVFTYSITDYSLINILQDFGLVFLTNTTAQAGDIICVNVVVTPVAGDNNTGNNNYQYCYQVVNSYDPNYKEVYPINVSPGYNDYFVFTVHFQNTGNAPAINILLTDTLDSNLEPKTFQVIYSSHNNSVSLDSNVLSFRFPNILLPDSATDEPGSQGFIQYRIKPKANLVPGTQIANTAYIFFDYNPAIITNTTISEFLPNNSIEQYHEEKIYVYPNPNHGFFTVVPNQSKPFLIAIFNIFGEEIFKSEINLPLEPVPDRQTVIDISAHSKGIYLLQIISGSFIQNKKLILE